MLDLQTVDTALAQLQYRRKNLPEHAAIAELQSQRNRVAADLVAAQTAVSDLELEQSKAESDLDPVRQRLVRNQQRIADGTIADPKALSGLVDEVEHLGKRISDLEDAELEVMEQLETAGTQRDTLRQQLAVVDEQLATLLAKRDQQYAELDADVAERQGERTEIVPLLPSDLLTLYDRLRANHGGVGAAELRHRRCTGCQLEINSAELRAFATAAADEVLRCEECGRILVRTAESGL